MNKVRAGSEYVYRPVGMDIWDSRVNVESGTRVRVVKLPGCPAPNTMGHCHIQSLDGSFLGLVLTNSLTRE